MTLVIPWLAPADQEMIFPNNQSFETPEAQEQFVRAWARKRTGMPCNFKVQCPAAMLSYRLPNPTVALPKITLLFMSVEGQTVGLPYDAAQPCC